MRPDLGTNLTLQATRRFTGLWVSGYQTTSPARSPIMMDSDGYIRLLLGLGNTVETYLARLRKDFSFTDGLGRDTNRRARSPLLYTLHPLTLADVMVTRATPCNASAGTQTPNRAGWGNEIRVGRYNVDEQGDNILASYGGDINDVSLFNKYDGRRIPFSCSTGSNWSGVVQINDDGTIYNKGTANYWTQESLVTAASTDLAKYSVYPVSTGYRIVRTDAQGKQSVHMIPLGYNPSAIDDVKTNRGQLVITSVIGNDVVVSVIHGENTPPMPVLPTLPATGYVKAVPIDMTLAVTATGTQKPILIGRPNPTQGDSYATEPKYKLAFRFKPVTAGRRIFLRLLVPYMDGPTLPSDIKVWRYPNTWDQYTTRKNMPKVVGDPFARRNVGNVQSEMLLIDLDVTAGASSTEDWSLCIEGTEPPYYGQSGKHAICDETLLIETDESVPLPPPVPVKFTQTILASDFVGETIGERMWYLTNNTDAVVMDNDGFNYVTPANAKASAPRIDYKTKSLATSRYEVLIDGVGPDATRDSVFVSVNDGPLVEVNSFTKTGTVRSAGTFDLAAGVLSISLYARECGCVIRKIIVNEL